MQKKWQRTHSPENKKIPNKIAKELKNELLKIKNGTFQVHLERLPPTNKNKYSLWKATLNKPFLPIPPLWKPNNTWKRLDQEKAQLYAEHLAKVYQSDDGIHDDKVTVQLKVPLQICLLLKPVSLAEVKKIITKIKTNRTDPSTFSEQSVKCSRK